MNDAELDLRIRDLLEAVKAQAPAPPPFPVTTEAARQSAGASEYVASGAPRERRRPRARVLVAAAATVAVIIAGVLVWTRGTEGSAPPAEPGPVITGEVVEVVHELWQYTQSADLTCPNGEISTGEFATFTIETWTDLSGARIRQDIVYPDGTSRSVLQLDATSLARPAPVRAGEQRGQIVGCRGVMNFLTEPATLGLEDFMPDGPASAGVPEGLGRDAAHAEAPQVDSLGRTAELWTVTGGGSIESVGLLRQTMNYYLDPDTGLLIERVLNEQVAPYGSFTQRFTRTSREQVSVDASIFDPAALDDVSTTAATVPAAVFQEEGTCARGGSASVCFIRRDGALLVKGAGLAPDSTVELFFNVGGIRRSSRVVAGAAGMIDTQAVLDPIDPAGAAIVVGVAGLAADGYPLNNSITDRP